MKHQKSVSSRLLAVLLCLSLLVQMGAWAWAAESVEPGEGMLSVESVQEESAELETQSDAEAPEAEASDEAETENASEAKKSSEESETKKGQIGEKAPEQEPEVDSPEFWSEFREEYAEDGDYLKRFALYQEEGVKRAFEDDDDIAGTIEAMSDEELELMAANNGTTKSPFTGKTYTHAAVHKGKTVVLGIDVSKWQDSIDWHKVKAAGVKYVILRCGYTRVHSFNMNKDERFDKFIQEAHDAGLQIGIYYFSQATTESEAKKEAQKTLEQIKPYKSWITLPVFMDIEKGKMSGKAYRINKVSRTQGTKNVKAYCKIIADAGYKAYYYGNPDDLANLCDVAQLGDYGCWLARYATSTTYSGSYDFWQYSSVGKVNGIRGGVDCNFWYTGKGTADDPTSDTTKPAQVTGLAVTETGDTYVDLKWNVISNAESYTVEGKTNGGSYQTLMTFTGDFSKGNTCRVTGLTPATAYKIRVKAVNRKGTGAASEAISVTTAAAEESEETPMFRGQTGDAGDDAAPDQTGDTSGEEPDEEPVYGLGAPEKVSAKWTADGVQVDWSAVDGAKYYRVFYNTVVNKKQWIALADTAELTYLHTDVPENAYQYAVRCTNKTASLSDRDYASDTFTTANLYATPKVTSAENTGSGIKLTWKKVGGAKKYVAFRCPTNKDQNVLKNWSRVGVTTSASITDKAPKAGDAYRYTVRVITPDEEEYLSLVDLKGVVQCRLVAPKVLSVKNNKKGTLTAEWTDTTGAEGYEARFVLGSATTKKSLNGWARTNVSVAKLTKGKTYSFSVRTRKKVKGVVCYSAWSAVKKCKVSK